VSRAWPTRRGSVAPHARAAHGCGRLWVKPRILLPMGKRPPFLRQSIASFSGEEESTRRWPEDRPCSSSWITSELMRKTSRNGEASSSMHTIGTPSHSGVFTVSRSWGRRSPECPPHRLLCAHTSQRETPACADSTLRLRSGFVSSLRSCARLPFFRGISAGWTANGEKTQPQVGEESSRNSVSERSKSEHFRRNVADLTGVQELQHIHTQRERGDNGTSTDERSRGRRTHG
jgi:hypothetical protein